MSEVWKPVVGLEQFVEVSNMGRLRSLERTHPRGGTRGGRILRQSVNIHGYSFACVRHAGRKTNVYVHRAAATAFLPNPDGLPQVNHIDGVKRNNVLSNLEWCTVSHNNAHKFRVLGYQQNNIVAVVAFNDAEERRFGSLSEAGSAGFNIQNISAVLAGRRKTTGGYQWKRA